MPRINKNEKYLFQEFTLFLWIPEKQCFFSSRGWGNSNFWRHQSLVS